MGFDKIYLIKVTPNGIHRKNCIAGRTQKSQPS